MILKNNKLFDLPPLRAGSFSGVDRLEIPYSILILRDVLQRQDNGNIELICKAKDGPEEKSGGIQFITDDRTKKDTLYSWLRAQIGKSIETVYNSEFTFKTSSAKKCPKCASEMFQSMEPKVANLANTASKFPNQTAYWRCSNNNCDHKEIL